MGRRGREAWTHGVTFPGLRSPLQWAGEEQARRRVPGPGSHTARTPAHPQATGRSTGVIGRRDRQELEQGGREQQALCPVWRRGRGQGMGGGASLGRQLELTSQRQPLLPLQGGVRLRASGPCGAQMRQLGPQRDMDVSHLSYSAGVGRGQRQGTGDFRGKAEDEGSSQTCPCPVTSPVPLIEVTITDLRKRHSLA